MSEPALFVFTTLIEGGDRRKHDKCDKQQGAEKDSHIPMFTKRLSCTSISTKGWCGL